MSAAGAGTARTGRAAVAIAALLAHALAVSIVWSAPERLAALPDAREYLALGANLAAGHGFSQRDDPPYVPDLRRTPVFPALLAAVFLAAGPDARAAALANVAIGLATIAMVFAIVRRRYGERAAVAAGLVLALDPLSLVYHTVPLTETTFALLLVVAVWLLIDPRFYEAGRAATLGLVLGTAALCRPIGLYLPLALLPLFALRWKQVRPRRLAAGFAVMNLVYAAVAGAWLLRNVAVFGVPALTSLGGVNMYFHRAAYVAADEQSTTVEDVRARWEREFEARSAGWSEAQKIDWMTSRARTIIAADLGSYLRAYMKALGRMAGPETYDTHVVWGIETGSRAARTHAAASWLHVVCAYVLAAIGLTRVLRQPLAATSAIVLLYFVLIGGPEVYARFRMPLMPLLAMLAGAACLRLPAPGIRQVT